MGIDRWRLCRLLKKLDQIPQTATNVEIGNMVFEAAKTVPSIEAFKMAVPLRDVPEYLGASKRQVEALYRAGKSNRLFLELGPVRSIMLSLSGNTSMICSQSYVVLRNLLQKHVRIFARLRMPACAAPAPSSIFSK